MKQQLIEVAFLAFVTMILVPLLAVGLVWGITNVLMKKGSAGITELPQKSSKIESTIQEMIFLITRPLYILSFLGNMSGSVLFYYTLSHSDVSLVGPIANAVTFIVTSLTGRILEKEHLGLGSIFGMICVILGVGICVHSKSS